VLKEARSHQQAGRFAEAAALFRQRADAGGNDEEAWYARWQYARCLRELADQGGFLRQALMAFNQRPQRAEPLYDLARFYRERGMNDASVLFCEAGFAVSRPGPDALFVEEFVYTAGLREEYSIVANYARDPARKGRGYAACNWLALNREIPSGSRDLARYNLEFYIQPASAMMPSFTARRLGFTASEGRWPMNPSVALWGEQIVVALRTVNYTLAEDGRYVEPDGARHTSQNFLLRLNSELEAEASAEILPPEDLPAPAFDDCSAFGDLRLFVWQGELWCTACYRELTPEGWYEQVLAHISGQPAGPYRLTDWRVLRRRSPDRNEKNWMPRVVGDELQFIYSCDPTRVLDEGLRTVAETIPAIAADEFKGGSQAIPFDGGWLALIHEARERISDGQRNYRHRFVWFDKVSVLRGVSRPFYFHKRGIEFAAGLAWHPDGKRLLVSYGVRDSEAWTATVEAEEVRQVLEDAEWLPSGVLSTTSSPEQASALRHEKTTKLAGRDTVQAAPISSFKGAAGSATMKVLVLCHPYPNFVPDLLLHGLRKLLGDDVVEYPRKDALYEGILGQPYLDKVDGLMADDSEVDRSEIGAKMSRGFFDIVICDIRAFRDNSSFLENNACPLAIVDGEDTPAPIKPGNYVILRRETDGSDFSVPLQMALPAEVMDWIDRHRAKPKNHSIGFLGMRSTDTPDRNALLDELVRLFPDSLIDSWERPSGTWRGRDGYYRDLQSCKIALSLPGAGYDTFRYWENAACNVVHVAKKIPLLIPNDFRSGREIVRFVGIDDLARSVERVLSGAIEWQEFAERSRERLRHYHTTERRARATIDRLMVAFAA
jgi:Glycosyl transferases group 1